MTGVPFVGAGAPATGSAAWTVSIPVPSGVQQGDLLIAFLALAGSGNSDGATGWTLLRRDVDTGGHASHLFYRIAGASEPSAYTFDTDGKYSTNVITAWRGVMVANPIDGHAATLNNTAGMTKTAPSVTTATAGTVARFYSSVGNRTWTAPPGHLSRVAYSAGGGLMAIHVADDELTTAGATGSATATDSGTVNSTGVGQAVGLRLGNVAPNAPTLSTLVGGEVIDRAAVNRASHSFSDPDAGDSQSAFDHRYRPVGSSTWTSAYVVSPNTFHDYPAGTFAAGDYERQVRTYDSKGVVGPWSASGFFTAADGPATPTITDPIQNDTIAASSRDVTWSAPAQDAYQLQVLDGGLVEHDSGTVVTTQRSASGVPFPDNNVSRSIRVRVRYGGLWSSWYTIAVSVSYTPPPVPSVTQAPDGGTLIIGITNPSPGPGEPAVAYNDVWVDDGDGKGEVRKVTMLPTNTPWPYELPVSGHDYTGHIRVVAVAINNTTASSS